MIQFLSAGTYRLAARAVREVHEHGHGQGGQAGQEGRSEEAHQRALTMRCRRER